MSAQAAKGRDRQEKILQAIFEVSAGTTKLCAYEDIVVKAWKLYPEEFGLRGYTELYPDSSDLHKPLYGPLKRDGYVRSQNKKFGLTERGISLVSKIRAPDATQAARSRLERHQIDELARLIERPAIKLVLIGRTAEMLDTDLYDFYGVTVRTPPGDFAGRVATVDSAIDTAVEIDDPSVDPAQLAVILQTRNQLREKFDTLVAARTAPREKQRR